MIKNHLNPIIFVFLLILYIVGQFLIGTYLPADKQFYFNTPSDIDFLYYGAIINTLTDTFPPQNPAFGGEKLTQPYLHYYPAALLGKLANPYNSIRILNVLYLIILGLVLRKYFPEKYGFALLILFGASTVGAGLNSMGVDFIARGFTHAPFFILLTVAFFSPSRIIRYSAIFLAALVNGYLMVMVIIFLAVRAVWKRDRENILLLASGLVGILAASIFITSAVSEKPFYFILTESFYFDPAENLIHATPFFILIFFYRQREMILLFVIALLFGSFIHYNPFFAIFMIYYAGAMLVAGGESVHKKSRFALHLVLALLFIGFLFSGYSKYRIRGDGYYPRFDSKLESSFNWIRANTEPQACFMAVTADAYEIALVMQYRPVYLGFIGHVAHLGINWKERYNNITRTYRMGLIPSEVDYIFYGPIEQRYFPGISLPYPVVYRDDYVTICRSAT
nr:hypothetical protein [candidate division Zixibacteria bacterium]